MELGDWSRTRRRRRRRRIVALGVALSLVLSWGVLASRPHGNPPRPSLRKAAAPAVRRRPRPAAVRPPQFLVVSFDGSGGVRLWPYWRSIARRAGAHFTFFVSGVYLLDRNRRDLYHPPRHPTGSSDIGFALREGGITSTASVRGMLEQMAAAYREGNEIATHFNGHFCSPYAGNVGEWSRTRRNERRLSRRARPSRPPRRAQAARPRSRRGRLLGALPARVQARRLAPARRPTAPAGPRHRPPVLLRAGIDASAISPSVVSTETEVEKLPHHDSSIR
jgi:hypothetical protein